MNAMNDPTAAATYLEQFIRAERARILNNPPPPILNKPPPPTPYPPSLNNLPTPPSLPPPPHGPPMLMGHVFPPLPVPRPNYNFNRLNQAPFQNPYHKLEPYRALKPPPPPPVRSMREYPMQEKVEEPIEDDMTMVARILKVGVPSHSAKEAPIQEKDEEPKVGVPSHSPKEAPTQEKDEEPMEEFTDEAGDFGLANEDAPFEEFEDAVFDKMFAVDAHLETMGDEIATHFNTMRDTVYRMREEIKNFQRFKEAFKTKQLEVHHASSIVERAEFRFAEKIHQKESQAFRKENRDLSKAEADFRYVAAGLWNTKDSDYVNRCLSSYEQLIEEMESQLQYAKTITSAYKRTDGKKRKRANSMPKKWDWDRVEQVASQND